MEQMETKIIITYRWWRNDDEDIVEKYINQLDAEALSKINSMIREGYTSGDLNTSIDDIDYQGWWRINTKRA